MIAIEYRVGCVAVVDTDIYKGPGLSRDSPGVLRFWIGRPCRPTTRNKWQCWCVPYFTRLAAERYCTRACRPQEP